MLGKGWEEQKRSSSIPVNQQHFWKKTDIE